MGVSGSTGGGGVMIDVVPSECCLQKESSVDVLSRKSQCLVIFLVFYFISKDVLLLTWGQRKTQQVRFLNIDLIWFSTVRSCLYPANTKESEVTGGHSK